MGGGWAHQTRTTNENQCHHSLFGCHIAAGDVAPGFHMGRWRSFPSVSDRFHLWAVIFFCKWLFASVGSCFQSWAVVFILGWLFVFVGGCLCSWAAIGVHGQWVLLQFVVGMGHHVMVVISGVIVSLVVVDGKKEGCHVW